MQTEMSAFPSPAGQGEPHEEPQEIRAIYKFVRTPPAPGESSENKLFVFLPLYHHHPGFSSADLGTRQEE